MPGYRVYIDESGDEGFRFGQGSSEWFVVAGVVVDSESDLEIMELVNRTKTLLHRPLGHALHFRDLDHEERLPYVAAIAGAEVTLVFNAIHKPTAVDPNASGLYVARLAVLLRQVEESIRGLRSVDHEPGPLDILVSNRECLSTKKMRVLAQQLHAQDREPGESGVDLGRVRALSHGRRLGLQVADALASSVYYALTPSRYGFTEDRYLRMLAPRVIRDVQPSLSGAMILGADSQADHVRQLLELTEGNKNAGPGP